MALANKQEMQKLMDFAKNHFKHNKVTAPVDDRVITEQLHAKSCDINNIVAQFQKTGVLPQTTKIPVYSDNTNTPDLIDAFYTVQEAELAFLDLPARVRKLMDNDPRNLEHFMLDPQNTDILKKHGLLVEREKIPEKTQKTPEPLETKEK